MTHLFRATLASLFLLVLVSTARAGPILAYDRGPAEGVAIDAKTGEPTPAGDVSIDPVTGAVAGYRLPDAIRPDRARDRGVALARLASERPRRRPVEPPAPEREMSGESEVHTARVAAPAGSPPGGLVLIGAGMIGLASFLIRRRFRPTYT